MVWSATSVPACVSFEVAAEAGNALAATDAADLPGASSAPEAAAVDLPELPGSPALVAALLWELVGLAA